MCVVRVVKTGGAGAGCRCRVLVLAAGCAHGGDRVLGKLANWGAVDFWSHHGCARSHSKAVDVVDGALREHQHALVPEDDVILEFDKLQFLKRMSKVCRCLKR